MNTFEFRFGTQGCGPAISARYEIKIKIYKKTYQVLSADRWGAALRI